MKLPSISERAKSIAKFDPKRHRLNVAALDFTIKEARRIRDWPKLEEAVDAKIKQQHGFVAWWDANVRKAGGDRQSEKALAGSAADGLPQAQAEKETGMPHQRVSDLAATLKKDPDAYRDRLLGIEYRAAFLSAAELADSQRIQQRLSNEHYTPARYIEAAREVLGSIDLDPASNDLAQETVRATRYFTKDDDGLAQEWHGRVWLNPPYGDLVGQFIDKLSAERVAGRVTASICVVNADCTDTSWFQQLRTNELSARMGGTLSTRRKPPRHCGQSMPTHPPPGYPPRSGEAGRVEQLPPHSSDDELVVTDERIVVRPTAASSSSATLMPHDMPARPVGVCRYEGLARTNKSLARSNKSRTGANATK